MNPPIHRPDPWFSSWHGLSTAFMRWFHAYAAWLVSISWKRFFVLSILLIVLAAITQELPLFSWTVTETVEEPIEPPSPPKKSKSMTGERSKPLIRIDKPRDSTSKDEGGEGLDISIDERGIRITPRKPAAQDGSATHEADAASAPAAPAAPSAPAPERDRGGDRGGISITLPPGVSREVAREALEGAREAIREAGRTAREAAAEAARDAEQAGRDLRQAQSDVREAVREAERGVAEAVREAERAAREAIEQAERDAARAGRSFGDFQVFPGPTRKVQRTRVVRWGDFLTDLALIWILVSIIIKATYKGRVQAEAKAAQAAETAEAESLKRQVVEARMAAMQAQVEPHFLFNTLASIDHLIETDPARASQMQKNLIALLRASMPTMREANANGVRDIGRELAVIRPYLEILKVRMEDRLDASVDVPEGLHSAEFPPMMLQSLVENAIKHGLEPKAEGGSLAITAEIVHGKLAVSVADTGLGFGQAATAGTGVGLANIRERLQLLYGTQATLAITENRPSGTRVTITVPYRPIEGAKP